MKSRLRKCIHFQSILYPSQSCACLLTALVAWCRSQNRFSNDFVGDWLNPVVDADAQLQRLAAGRYSGDGLVPRISNNMLGENLRIPRPPQQVLPRYCTPYRLPLQFDPRIPRLVFGTSREPPASIPDGPVRAAAWRAGLRFGCGSVLGVYMG